MNNQQLEDQQRPSLSDRLKAAFNDLIGLPPGDGTPHGAGRPARVDREVRDTLTSDDLEELPAQRGTGIKPQN